MRGHLAKKKGRYYAVLYQGTDPVTGKEIRRYHPAGDNKAAADKILSDLVSKYHAGEYVPPLRTTFGEYLLDLWLPAKSAQLKVSTFDSYKALVEKHIIPALGNVGLQELTAEHLDRFYAEKLAGGRRRVQGGLSAKYVRNMHVVIRKALADAVRKGRVVRNVATLADPPKLSATTRRPLQVWNAEQLRTFLEANSEHRHYAAWFVAAFTGVRRGELLGMRWRHLDLEARRLHAGPSLLSVSYKLIESDGKTERAERVIDLDDHTVAVVRAHRRRQAEERLAIGERYEDDDFVFAKPDGRPEHPDVFTQSFETRVARSGLPRISLHGLRHTHASLLLKAGVPVKVVSERLGHANVAFTINVYQSVLPGMQSEAAALFAAEIMTPRLSPRTDVRYAGPPASDA